VPLDADGRGVARRPFFLLLWTSWCCEERDEMVILTCRTLHFSRVQAEGDRWSPDLRQTSFEPTAASADGPDQARPTLNCLRPTSLTRSFVREQYPGGIFLSRLCQGIVQRLIIWAIGCFVASICLNRTLAYPVCTTIPAIILHGRCDP